MLTRFRNLATASVIALVLLFSTTVPKANAGMAIFYLGLLAESPYHVGYGIGTMISGVLCAFYSPIVGAVFVLLDANGTATEVSSETALAKAFPVLADQPDALKDLAGVLSSETAKAAARATEAKFTVSIPQEVTRQILEPTNLSNGDIEVIVQALK